MIGKCPNCGIRLKNPPFNERETNEVILTLRYRNFIENNKIIYSIKNKGYCEICNAKIKDLEKQIILTENK